MKPRKKTDPTVSNYAKKMHDTVGLTVKQAKTMMLKPNKVPKLPKRYEY